MSWQRPGASLSADGITSALAAGTANALTKIASISSGASTAQSAGPSIALSTSTGDATISTGNTAGDKFSVKDKDGIEQLRVDETGLTMQGSLIAPYPMIKLGVDNDSLGIMGCSSDTWDGCQMYLNGGQVNPGTNESGTFGVWGTTALSEHLFGYFSSGGKTRQSIGARGTQCLSPVPVSIPTGAAWTTLCAIDGNQTLRFATITGHGTILLEWDGTTLSKMIGPVTLVVAGSAGATEIAFRVSGGNLQASNGTGTSRNGSSGFAVQH